MLAVSIGLFVVLGVLMVASGWMVYAKAGQPGWASLVPIYSLWVFLKMVGKPGWWILLFMIPVVDVILPLILIDRLAKAFGKKSSYAVGLLLLPFIFLPMLAFGDANYLGPNAADKPSKRPRKRLDPEDEEDEDDVRPSRRRERDDGDRPRNRKIRD